MFHGTQMMPNFGNSLLDVTKKYQSQQIGSQGGYQNDDMNLLDKSVALNQKFGSVVKQGQVGREQQRPEFKLQISESITKTKRPKTSSEATMKMKQNDVLPVAPEIATSTIPVLANAIKQGARPEQAARAMKTEAAVVYSNSKQEIAKASKKDQQLIGKMLRSTDAKQAKIQTLQGKYLEKETALHNKMNRADLVQKAQSQLNDNQMQTGLTIERLSRVGKNLDNPQLFQAVVNVIQSEGVLEFEAKEGSELTTQEQLAEQGLIAPENLLLDAEIGAILLQAALEDVDANEGLAVITDSSAQALQPSETWQEQLMKPQNLLIGAVALFVLYKMTEK